MSEEEGLSCAIALVMVLVALATVGLVFWLLTLTGGITWTP